MNRKWIGVVVAIVLAAVGTWVLVSYVQGADNRALEGEETVAVLVISTPVSAGTAAEDIGNDVRVEQIPVKVQAQGSLASVEDLQSLEGLVASVDLVPGEQVIEARFITPQTLVELDDFVVPDGLLEVTLSLNPERALGGNLRPGDRVAVFASFAPFNLEATDLGGESDANAEANSADTEAPDDAEGATAPGLATRTPNTTNILLHNVLVTNVQVEELPQENTSEDAETSSLELSPSGRLLITLAMEPVNAERFIFTAEFGTTWLADESETVDDAQTPIQDRSTVYQDPEGTEAP